MGQKVNPIGLRLGVNKTWESKWYVDPREYKETLADNLVALRKMLYLSQTEFGNRTGISRIRLSMIECGKYEMTWSQFTSILFVFFMNRSTKQIIFRKKLFPDKLFAYLQCKHVDEDLDGFYKVI